MNITKVHKLRDLAETALQMINDMKYFSNLNDITTKRGFH